MNYKDTEVQLKMYNKAALVLFKTNRSKYDEQAKKWTRVYARNHHNNDTNDNDNDNNQTGTKDDSKQQVQLPSPPPPQQQQQEKVVSTVRIHPNVESIKLPYNMQHVSFCRCAEYFHKSYNDNNVSEIDMSLEKFALNEKFMTNMHIIGGSNERQEKFTKIECNNSQFSKSKSKSSKNNSKLKVKHGFFEGDKASLDEIGLENGENILTFKLYDGIYGNCVILIDKKKYYNVYCLDTNEWIVKRIKISLVIVVLLF